MNKKEETLRIATIRRGFLKGMAAAAIGGLVAGLGAPFSAASLIFLPRGGHCDNS